MSRKPLAPPPAVPQATSGNIHEIRSYRIITPLLGGGAKVKHPDSQTVVRASALRGLLRFWWRAMRGGHSNGDIKWLKKREAEIWGGRVGSTMYPSKVTIVVKNAHIGSRVTTDNDLGVGGNTPIDDITSKVSYALFILRAQGGVQQEFDIRSDVRFDLEVTYPSDIALDVRAAIWAWQTFGGVGARTRRGLGAVELEKVNGKKYAVPTLQQIPEYFRDQLNYFEVGGKWPAGTPHVLGIHTAGTYNADGASVRLVAAKPNATANAIWVDLVQRYRNFRQERFLRAQPSGKFQPYGSSVWPDANGIRSKYGVTRHPQSDYRESAHVPRAQMGLPIVSQFINRKFDTSVGSVVQFIVENEVGRHASPVIFRPLAVDGGYVGMLLILGNSRIRGQVNLKANDGGTRQRFGGVHQVPTVGNTPIQDKGGDKGENRQPHGPTNTADVLAGLFNFMK